MGRIKARLRGHGGVVAGVIFIIILAIGVGVALERTSDYADQRLRDQQERNELICRGVESLRTDVREFVIRLSPDVKIAPGTDEQARDRITLANAQRKAIREDAVNNAFKKVKC